MSKSASASLSSRRRVLLAVVSVLLMAAISGCMPPGQIGRRPAQSPMDAVESYLRRYQPGPEPRLFQTTRIYDRHGRMLAERWEEGRRTWVPLNKVSKHLIDATIATEDSTFYANSGVDPLRVVGAMLQNYEEGEVVAGASTITMQLARNLFMGPDQRYDQSMDRKLVEAGLAQELTSLFSKDELLEMYLNLNNYGHLTYGPEAAAQVYFGKSAAELTLAEATLLAGIPQNPADLDLFTDFQKARARQRTVLDLMVRHQFLSPDQADAAFDVPIRLKPDVDAVPPVSPHFVQYVAESVNERLGSGALPRAGLTITTTLDLDMQHVAESIVAEKVAGLRKKHDLTNGALVAMRPGSGEVLAMVGSADFDNDEISGQVNVATSMRQPGSAIKPVLYATALSDNLISPATVLWDIPVTYTVSVNPYGADDIYQPRDYDGKFRGPLTVRTALANSLNIPSVKLLHGVTIPRMIESAQKMGIRSLSSDREYGLSLTLGGGEVTLLELTGAFATIANGGMRTIPSPILNATDALGRPVDLSSPEQRTQVISPAAAFQVTDILSDNRARAPQFGENSPLKLSRPAAAKTGTTTDFRDNWTIGFTRYLVTGVWAGNADGHPMKNTTGLTGAAPIWHDFMEKVIADPRFLAEIGAPVESDTSAQDWEFIPPPDVEQRSDCPPGLDCREGGEYYSKPWLEVAGDAGPLADSVEQTPSAPVYADRGGTVWTAYCAVEPAVVRGLLRLPGKLGLPTAEQEDAPQEQATQEELTERMHAMAWSLRHSLPINLGPCDELAAAAPRALRLDRSSGPAVGQVSIDLNAAMDPNAGGVAGMATTVVSSPARDNVYYLADSPANHTNCQGNYIMGQLLDSQGNSVAGVRVRATDEWGNVAEAVSKDGPSDYGLFDFPLGDVPNRYTIIVLDESGNAISAPFVLEHLQGAGGNYPCHSIILQGG